MNDTRKDIFKKIHERCFQFGSCNYKETGCSDCPINVTLAKAETLLDKQEQGLLISLPLKVGDVVYSYFRLWRKEDGIVPYQITNFTITQNKKGVWTKKYRAMWLVDGKTCDKSLNFSFDEIGKTVFLTETEAEEALAKMGGK